MTVAAIESGVALLAEARDAIAAFQDMIRRKATTELDAWLDRAKGGLVAAFANGMTKDKAVVTAAIESSWSNGQTEGQICKLKLVKRPRKPRPPPSSCHWTRISGTFIGCASDPVFDAG